MKKFILFLSVIFLMSCEATPVLCKHEYKVVDTLHVAKNLFKMTLSYDVIIKYDSAYYYGVLSPKGNLTFMEHRKLKIKVK